jgi:hypothetical protein
LRFRRPDGRVIVEAPPLPPVPAASPAALTAWWRHEGIADDGEASLPSWDGGTVDYGWAVDSLRQAAVTP